MAIAEDQAASDAPLREPESDRSAPDLPARARTRVRKFATRVLMIFAPVHLYVAWSLIPDLTPEPILQAFGGVIMVVSTVLIPYGTLASQFVSHQALVDRLVWAGSLTMGWFSSVLVLTLVRETVLWVPGVRPWAHESALAVLAVSVAVTVVGFFNARRVARVVHVDVPLANLPPALDGFTIAQITDIHVGSTIKRDYVQGIVERVNELNADIVAVTGDVVDGKVSRLSGDTAPLAQLRARHGAYVVTGNHEYYSGADDWMEEFRRLGLQTLMNEHRVIDHDGANIVVAGINDFSAARVNPAHESDPAAAIAGSPDGAPKVLLAHQPRSADAALEAGFDLQLSGHTHGGQFWPWNHFVRMQQPYTAGLHRLGALWIYTSRGTGYWGPPKRFGVPSEITLIRLTSQLASRLIPEA